MVAVSFIGGGNQSIQRKPLTVYRKSLTNIHSKYKTNSDKTVFPEKFNMIIINFLSSKQIICALICQH